MDHETKDRGPRTKDQGPLTTGPRDDRTSNAERGTPSGPSAQNRQPLWPSATRSPRQWEALAQPSVFRVWSGIQGAAEPEPRAVHHMRVNLRRGDVHMAEQILHGSDIGAAFEEVRGEAVAEGVWGDAFVEARLAGRGPDHRLEGPVQEMMAAVNPRVGIERQLA